MKCPDCGAGAVERRATNSQPYCYDWSGLRNVHLAGITVYECGKCGSIRAVIPRIEELNSVISGTLLTKPGVLTGREVRFLRKQAEFSAQTFSRLLGVTPVHFSRVENEHSKVSPQVDKLARALVAASQDADVKEILLGVARGLRSLRGSVFRLTRNKWEIKAA